MSVKILTEDKGLRVCLQGDVDHHSAFMIRKTVDSHISRRKPPLLVLDFGEVTFMDSSGIGLVMGRYKLMKSIGGEIRVENLSASAYRVMRLAGLERLGEIKQKETVG